MPSKTKGEDAHLVRVRNNQRRSRARKREYVAELERKVQAYSTLGASPCTPQTVPQDTITWLENENRKLRELLALAGVDQALIDTHLEGGVQTRDDCSQNSPRSSLNTVASPGTAGISLHYAHDDALLDSYLDLPEDCAEMMVGNPPSLTGFGVSSPMSDACSMPKSLPATLLPDASNISMLGPCDNPLCPDDAFLPTSAQPKTGRTLCSAAYGLLVKHNQRGVDMFEIGIRLWNGFVKGDGNSGCTVENELLISVLEYIKG